MRARCEACTQHIGTVIPKGGDGSVSVYRRHRDAFGEMWCVFSRMTVPAYAFDPAPSAVRVSPEGTE